MYNLYKPTPITTGFLYIFLSALLLLLVYFRTQIDQRSLLFLSLN